MVRTAPFGNADTARRFRYGCEIFSRRYAVAFAMARRASTPTK
jgi:hypothetical protein